MREVWVNEGGLASGRSGRASGRSGQRNARQIEMRHALADEKQLAARGQAGARRWRIRQSGYGKWYSWVGSNHRPPVP